MGRNRFGLSILTAGLLLAGPSAFAQVQQPKFSKEVGRYSDGRAYRVDKNGNELLPCEFLAVDKTENPNIFEIHNNAGNCPVYLDGVMGMIYPDMNTVAMIEKNGDSEYEMLDR